MTDTALPPKATGSGAPQPVHLTPGQTVRGKPSRVARQVLALFGWTVKYQGLPAKQGMIIVYPHTSNWDFIIGLLAKWTMGLDGNFWGKDTLFDIPLLGRWMRYLGGIPINRRSPQGAVGQMAEHIQQAKAKDQYMWLIASPEGTRSARPHWKSGFYHVTRLADIPLGLAYIDWKTKEVGLTDFLRLGGDQAQDMAYIADILKHHVGYKPQNAAPVRFQSP